MDPQIRRQRTLDAIKRVVLTESLKQPVVMIFEDLHWIDAQTQALLDLLANSIASARILLLVNYGPEYHHECFALVAALPESRERDTREMVLQVALGGVIQGTRGFSADATAQAYARAKVLAEEVGEAASLQVIGGLHAAEVSQGNLRPALALSKQMLEIARGIGSASALARAYSALGQCHFLLGDLSQAREDLFEAIKHYREQNFVDALPLDPGLFALIWAAQNEWHLGHPDRARRHTDEARSLAHRQNNSYAMAIAADASGLVLGFCGDFSQAIECHDETVRLALDLGFPTRKAFGTINGAWVRARLGETGGAVERIRDALEALNAVRFQAFRSDLLGRLSETQALAGACNDALATVGQALQTNPDELIYRPELLNLRGELRVHGAAHNEAQLELAAEDFHEAIDLARHMQARSDELRATTNLARLLASQGHRDEARGMLAEIYAWFTEGFDTADLKDAEALLDELVT